MAKTSPLSKEMCMIRPSLSDRLLLSIGSSSSSEVTSNAVATTIQKYGRLDGIVLNAGTLHPLGRIASASLAPVSEWRNAFDINFFSLVHTLQAAIPHLRKEGEEIGGRVVFVSSGAATGGVAAWGPYNATKAAMNSLSRFAHSPNQAYESFLLCSM
jgi:NAD(P)-dependent dehydrogenase (short-subunit alcohol dehydrogenase family)